MQMKRPKILVVGSFVKDLIVTSDRFPKAGETVLGNDFSTASGGKGANQAVQAAHFGAEVTLVGKVGNDTFGKEMITSCQNAGINCRHVMVSRDVASSVGNVQIRIDKNRKTQNRIIVVPGANMTIIQEDVKFLENTIKDYDIVVLQMEIPIEINEVVAGYAYKNGVDIMLNPAPSGLISSDLMSKLTYISPNEYEAEDLTGIKIRHQDKKINTEDVKQCVDSLLKKGVKNVLITLGSLGAAFGNREDFFICPTLDGVISVDPTGAGDSFIGAFSTLVSQGIPHRQAVRIANYVGALTVSGHGAQPSLPKLSGVLELIKKRGETELLTDELISLIRKDKM